MVEAVMFVREPQIMYNLTVTSAHTFFVGKQQWLVHNSCDINDIPKLGGPGRRPGVRVMQGGVGEARQLFDELTVNAIELRSLPNGKELALLPNGSVVTYRPVSSYKSNYVPTIDVNSPVVGIWEIKFEQ